jgi:hypothetical protein
VFVAVLVIMLMAVTVLVVMPVPVVMTVLVVMTGTVAARTGRITRHSTAGLAVVPAARLVATHLDEGVGDRHPQLRRERSVVGGPVREHGSQAGLRAVLVV